MTKRSNKKKEIRIRLPENVKNIIAKLKEEGYEAYAVGGCVRDSILGREPEDWDITTSALPEQIKAAFRRTVDTGIEHGTVTVMIGDDAYEVTTYRIDGEYKDGRHPSSVEFTDALSEDLRRRDFTINAMAYNDEKGIVDLFDGREDIRRGIIRCVGVADERFNEDALRILRAVRFAAQLDFDIDADTRDAISDHGPRLKAVSKERILVEISKLICSEHIEKVADIFQLGIIPYIAKHFREINVAQLMGLKTAAINANMQHDEADTVFPGRAFDLCSSVGTDKRYVRFALLTEGMSAEHVDDMLKDLKADNLTRKNAAKLAEWVLTPLPADKYELKRIMSEMSPEIFMDLLCLKLVSVPSLKYEDIRLKEDIFSVFDIYNEIAANCEPIYMNDLALSGSDLIAKGLKAGPEMGAILKKMLDHVWRVPADNDAETLIGLFVK